MKKYVIIKQCSIKEMKLEGTLCLYCTFDWNLW